MDNVDPLTVGVNELATSSKPVVLDHKSSKAHHLFFGNNKGAADNYETFLSHDIGEEDNNNNENGRQFTHNYNKIQQKHVYRKDGFLWIVLPYVLMGIVACFVVILHDGNDGVGFSQSSLLGHSSSRKHKTRKRVGRFWLLETEKEPNNNTTVIARYNGPDPKEMNEEQQEIRDYILESRPRTGLSGPFGPWLSVPSIAKPASELGKACRYDTSLSKRESELVILLTGAKHQSKTELTIHTKEAINAAGMDPAIPNAIWKHLLGDAFSSSALQKRVLPLLETDRERAIAMFCGELLETSGVVSDQTYQATKLVLDNQDSVLVEITSIVGYYTYVSYTLNVFRIPP